MAPSPDRLSGLNDDVLRRILHFAPAREGASTSALSKRWTTSPLWRSSGALNLEIRLPDEYTNRRRFYARRDAIVSRAHETLAAIDEAGVPLTRLTFRVEAENSGTIENFLHRDVMYNKKHDVVDDLISHRAARRVEELRIAAVDGEALRFTRRVYDETSRMGSPGIYRLRLGSLPSAETIRVLDLTGCSDLELPPPSDVPFPRLASLRLLDCSVTLEVLQGLIVTAPVLAVIHLEFVHFKNTDRNNWKPTPEEGAVRRLSCPTAAVLVLDRCVWKKEDCVEIDAPKLWSFRYRGLLGQILVTPPSPDLARADITILGYNSKDPHDVPRNFWRFVHSCTHTKEMRLSLPNLEGIAIAKEARRVQLLPEFCNLERLELKGVHRPTGKTAAVAIANLLRCCPALRDFKIRLNINKMEGYQHWPTILEKKYSYDLQDSINRFKRHQWDHPTMLAGDKDEDGDEYDDVPDILALSGRSFECLRSSLRRVGLQFRRAKTDCFGIKLIKFFAENSIVLEEMCIDSGTDKLCDHLNPKVEAWISNSSKRRKPNPTNARKLLVSPLERRN